VIVITLILIKVDLKFWLGLDGQLFTLGLFVSTVPETDLEKVKWGACKFEVVKRSVCVVQVLKFDPLIGIGFFAIDVLVDGMDCSGQRSVRPRGGEADGNSSETVEIHMLYWLVTG